MYIFIMSWKCIYFCFLFAFLKKSKILLSIMHEVLSQIKKKNAMEQKIGHKTKTWLLTNAQ